MDKMSGHTPGPWIWYACNDGAIRIKIPNRKDGGRTLLACIGLPLTNGSSLDRWYTEKGDEANARLIAAAPEMLEALRLINEIAERESVGGKDAPDAYGTIGRQARAAIAKAEGR